MLDMQSDKVILSKAVRRRTIELGRSIALERKHVALMDDGSVRVITERRPSHFLPRAARVVSFKVSGFGRLSPEERFAEALEFIRDRESLYITNLFPVEVRRAGRWVAA